MSSMRINTITFMNASNFGAALQCIALQKKAAELSGGEVRVISYLPEYITKKQDSYREAHKARERFKKKKSPKLLAAMAGKYVLCFFAQPKLRRRKAAFDAFLKENITLTRDYTAPEELTAQPPEGDIFLCGSDQIWNPALTGDRLDPAFFLSFVPEGKRKAAYAVSLGELDTEKHSSELKELTEGFERISVREMSSQGALSAALGREVECVLDPTLLLGKEDYEALEKPVKTKGDYVLLYTMQNSHQAVSLAKRIGGKLGVRVIDLSANTLRKFRGTERVTDIGPGEFLSYVKNARWVVTNSFHGTAFSIIYKKDFYTLPHSTRGGRMTDLLRSLGLEDRLVTEGKTPSSFDPTDYNDAEKRLQELKDTSLGFLKEALELR